MAIEKMQWRVSKKEEWQNLQPDLIWFDLGIESQTLERLQGYQKVNHFPAMYQISRKTFLARNLKRMRKMFPDEFQFFPRTWCWPVEASELRQYLQSKI